MNLLIPYVKLPSHHDPLFEEFTYGDLNGRGRKLKALQPGDHVFFIPGSVEKSASPPTTRLHRSWRPKTWLRTLSS